MSDDKPIVLRSYQKEIKKNGLLQIVHALELQ